MSDTTQIFEIYIKAPPQKIWDAITSPEWTAKYGYQARAEYDLRPGGVARHHATAEMVQMGLPEVIIDGEDISRYDTDKLQAVRRKFGYLFQSAALINWIELMVIG